MDISNGHSKIGLGTSHLNMTDHLGGVGTDGDPSDVSRRHRCPQISKVGIQQPGTNNSKQKAGESHGVDQATGLGGLGSHHHHHHHLQPPMIMNKQ